MTERDRRTLVAHGALVFLVGLMAGFPFAFEILGRAELWPIPGGFDFDPPGDVRGWRMAHLEGILNGMLLFGVAAVAPLLQLGPRGAAWVTRGLLVCAWGNIIASWIGPLSETRGLAFSGASWNSLVYLLFIAAIIGIVGAMVAIYAGARQER
ncbi:MAG: hypothetical protein JRH01_05370 [Deltaproteobacteria bacterium]|nr:hypothetical protein [Deltaproteobacteria bacterium]MBW2392709.1 hypothetical protein [Deltaproteobacteria bacterium]